MVMQVMKKELRFHSCGFSYDPVDSMVRSQWQPKSKNTFYFFYRWVVAAIFVAMVIISLYSHLQEFSFDLFFIYLTHWGIILNMIVGIYGTALVSIWYFHTEYREMPPSFKIYWALHNVTLATSYVNFVSIAAKTRISLSSIMNHALNSVIMFIDFLIVAYPMSLYHAIQPMCFGACFAVFSYIYYSCGGVNEFGDPFIYTLLNWEKPENALTTVVAVSILVILVHMILFYIYKLRVFTQLRLFETELVMPTTTIELN
ncbi:protein rolling stone-like [Sitodiplosis mosellana]|uniref:protein rolling stone-like n=1 Tax=Sitodiplosis mosellana TaxID=263140 RepID=UPI00244411D3|nr:protein rolling stone-like [Sitodiplosis mosellana]